MKKRRTRFTWKEDRQLIQMAAASATLEEAAASRKRNTILMEKTFLVKKSKRMASTRSIRLEKKSMSLLK
jgi:hypothetical protein